MALSNVPFCLVQPPQKVQFLFNQLFFFFLLLLPNAISISFNFTSFNTDNITVQPDAFTNKDGLHLTKDTRGGPINESVGRALYHERVHLWDNSTGKLKVTDFTTNFSFIIQAVDKFTADGLAFFISPFDSKIPDNSFGGYLGLFSNETAINGTQNQIVAVEFDTYPNEWDTASAPHVGIDINSIVSNVSRTLPQSINITNGSTTYVWVSYDSASQKLSVFLTFATKTAYSWNSFNLSCIVDLTILPEWISVGFSATTGWASELHTILSWSFSSTLEAEDVSTQPNKTGGGFTQTNNTGNGSTKNKLGLIIGLAVSSVGVSCGIGLLCFLCWRKRAGGNTEDSEWEQCVVHRDIKSSNIMLDSNFNAKLGDFGLARLVDHELGLQTTVVAGTMGYLAPECFTTGTASKESDVYSFGVVCLEIACGRKPVDPQAEPSKVRLVEWVWDLYGNGQLLEAVDKRLGMEFDEGQIKSLMVVGLWCCHPDPTSRPSIRQVIHVLKFEASLPILPSKLPVPMYVGPPMGLCKLSNTSSGFTRSKDQTQCSCSSCSTNSSMSTGPSKPLLYSSKAEVELASTMD
ncbi:l-type lectin-domain containing receptor kinase ix.1 [Quercus suber]|uniref:non-specific serine/threonine protein kinase n=1 Tax=Quercus suber TaxID=58331 RepID=A0AAW0KK29_QUESU